MLCNQNMACNKAQCHNRWHKSPAALQRVTAIGHRLAYTKMRKFACGFLTSWKYYFPHTWLEGTNKLCLGEQLGLSALAASDESPGVVERREDLKTERERERERETHLRNPRLRLPISSGAWFAVWLADAAGHRDAQSAVCSTGLKGSLGTSGSLEPHKQESSSVSPHAGAAPITFSLFCATGSLFYISKTLQLLLSAEPRESGDFKAARQGFFSPQC